MRILGGTLAIALVAAQLGIAAQPASAAELDRRGAFADGERGAFAGVRLKMQLGGKDGTKARAGLTVAPTMYSRFGSRSQTSLGEGLELGFSPGKKAELTLGGRRLDQMSLLGEKPRDGRQGVSTLGTVAIVAGVVIVVAGVAFVHIMNEASCFHGGNSSDC